MKRFLALLLAAVMLLSLAACGGENTDTQMPDVPENTPVVQPMTGEMPSDEYDRGLWYGFLPEELASADPDTTVVTWKQYCTMLGKMIALYDESELPEWEKMTADAPDTEMNRDGAMVSLLFAAKTVDMASFNAVAPEAFGVYAPRVWDVVTMDYPVFDWNTPVDLGEGCSDSNHVGPSYDFCLRRISCQTGKSLLEFDDSGDLRLEHPFTLREALLSVLRLYESNENIAARVSENILANLMKQEKVQEILSDADVRRQSILNSSTTIQESDTFIPGETFTGTAYYISNGGSDSNDGRSTDTPFATMDALNRVALQYGDAVFFERGSVWRCASIPGDAAWTKGVTFSAYGEGEKPQFLGSVENGGSPDKWSIAYEDESGKKIWVYHRDMTEVAGIVLNNSEVANRDKAYWTGETYVTVNEDNWPTEGRTVYSVEEHLPDLWYFPDLRYPPDRQGAYNERIFHSWNEQTGKMDYVEGKLYFRCDAGNPGELYQDIEFIQPFPLVDGFADEQVYDNLCIRYSSMTFCSGSWNGQATGNGSVIQNMEVGFMGGNVTGYVPDTGSDDRISYNYGSMGCNGGAMSFAGSNITVRNNYIHHAFQEGIAFETFVGDPSMENSSIFGNLIEYCTQAILLCNWDEDVNENHIFRNIIVEDNLLLFSGEGNWFNRAWELDFCDAIVLQGGPCAHDGTLSVRNNTFAFATGALVLVDVYSEEYSQVFSGNTYLQYPDKREIHLANEDTLLPLSDGVKTHLGDEISTIIAFD